MTASIEAMAREAGMTQDGLDWFTDDCDVSTGALTRFAALVRAQAIEDAARLVQANAEACRDGGVGRAVLESNAAAIRALKDQQ